MGIQTVGGSDSRTCGAWVLTSSGTLGLEDDVVYLSSCLTCWGVREVLVLVATHEPARKVEDIPEHEAVLSEGPSFGSRQRQASGLQRP